MTKYCYLSIDNVTRAILYFILGSNHRFSADSLHYSHVMELFRDCYIYNEKMCENSAHKLYNVISISKK